MITLINGSMVLLECHVCARKDGDTGTESWRRRGDEDTGIPPRHLGYFVRNVTVRPVDIYVIIG